MFHHNQCYILTCSRVPRWFILIYKVALFPCDFEHVIDHFMFVLISSFVKYLWMQNFVDHVMSQGVYSCLWAVVQQHMSLCIQTHCDEVFRAHAEALYRCVCIMNEPRLNVFILRASVLPAGHR